MINFCSVWPVFSWYQIIASISNRKLFSRTWCNNLCKVYLFHESSSAHSSHSQTKLVQKLRWKVWGNITNLFKERKKKNRYKESEVATCMRLYMTSKYNRINNKTKKKVYKNKSRHSLEKAIIKSVFNSLDKQPSPVP